MATLDVVNSIMHVMLDHYVSRCRSTYTIRTSYEYNTSDIKYYSVSSIAVSNIYVRRSALNMQATISSDPKVVRRHASAGESKSGKQITGR
jgi:hypothetical protein